MPRGRKKKVELTIDQQIEKVNFEIKELNEQIKEKKEIWKGKRKRKHSPLSPMLLRSPVRLQRKYWRC